MQNTSLLAFYQAEEEGLLGDMQKKIYKAICAFPGRTDKELSIITGMPINCVTPRRNELVKKNYIWDAGTRKCSITKRLAHTWEMVG